MAGVERSEASRSFLQPRPAERGGLYAPPPHFMSSRTGSEQGRTTRIGRNTRRLFQFWRGAEVRPQQRRAATPNVIPEVEEPAPLAYPINVAVRVAGAHDLMVEEEGDEHESSADDLVLHSHPFERDPQLSAEPVDPLASFHALLLAWLYRADSQGMEMFWNDVEQQTAIRRETLSYTLIGVLTVVLVLSNLAELVCTLVGVIYPMMCTYEMLKMNPNDVPEALRRHWLCYWCLYGLITGCDFLWRALQGIFPFFQIAKALVLFAVALPDFQLSQRVYNYSVQPTVKMLVGLAKKYL